MIISTLSFILLKYVQSHYYLHILSQECYTEEINFKKYINHD